MRIGDWLRALGLGQYEEQFRDHKIENDVLPRLTAEDLKDIGVRAVGDRRRLLDAIAALAESESETKLILPRSRQISAERRPMAVMFCDLVGSTGLAAQLDAEDWRDLVSEYLDQASGAVAGFGGHVHKRLGDGLMALFGYPQAQENDAERAVRAALSIQRALGDLNARNAARGKRELSARIGIELGPVVVDATGEVFGELPNIASRVQAAADPGAVLVTGNVQRQVAGLFVAEEQGAQNLKGAPFPVTLYRIVRASGGAWRGAAKALTPFIGREKELSLLMRRWERARAGHGQVAHIVGEPGIGKSRLLHEFHVRLGETPHTWAVWSASQLLQNTPLHPIAEWGRFRFGGDLPPEQRLADLEGTLRLIGLDPIEYAPLIATAVDIPLPPGGEAANLAPEETRRRQLKAIVAYALAGARSQSAVLVFEDLQWADPTSLELMHALVERGAHAPLLLVITMRSEFHPPWSLRSRPSAISLSPLDRAQVARMVGALAAGHPLPRDVVEGVSERTGGVPLFVEEVTRLLLERGAEAGAQAIPPTLQQSLAARLDRLGPAREAAQIGAVLGRSFTYALLRDVAAPESGIGPVGESGQIGLYEAGLALALERLVEADILLVDGAGQHATYRFKHALIQDAAYESLLKSRRQALHRRAAEILCRQPWREAAEPEAIAHHFAETGQDDLAIEWWSRAGDEALRRSAFREAVAHLSKAIAMADRQQSGRDSADVASRRVQLHVAYGNALIAAKGHGALETAEAFAKARLSASGEKDAPGRLAADYGLWTGCYARGELVAMRSHATNFLADVEGRPHSPEAGVAHRCAGTTHWFAGEYEAARDHLELALAFFEPGRDDDLAFRFGQDAGVAAMADFAQALWPLGEVDRAVSLMENLEARIAGLAHVGTLAFGRFHLTTFEVKRGDWPRAAPHALELARLAREHDLPLFRAFAVFFEGLAAIDGGATDGLDNMRRGAELLRERNALVYDGLVKIALAEAESRAGDPDRALAVVDEALATCERTGYRAFEAELRRARGQVLLDRDATNFDEAEPEFRSALAIAKRQGARSFGLRAALSLAKLFQSAHRRADALAVLAPAVKSFSPRPEMPEMREAERLLAMLARS